MSERTAWSALLAAALRLGVEPSQFWRLSLAEWRALVAPPLSDVLSRRAFETLASRFPDASA